MEKKQPLYSEAGAEVVVQVLPWLLAAPAEGRGPTYKRSECSIPSPLIHTGKWQLLLLSNKNCQPNVT